MRIAVIADLHDNLRSWDIIVSKLRTEDISVLLNCGDTCSQETLVEMASTFTGDIYTVTGNGDHDQVDQGDAFPRLHVCGSTGDITLGGRRIGIAHTPSGAKKMVATAKYDLVCHGHTHLKRWEKIHTTYVLNPGTAAGMFQYPTYAVVDCGPMHHEFRDILLP